MKFRDLYVSLPNFNEIDTLKISKVYEFQFLRFKVLRCQSKVFCYQYRGQSENYDQTGRSESLL